MRRGGWARPAPRARLATMLLAASLLSLLDAAGLPARFREVCLTDPAGVTREALVRDLRGAEVNAALGGRAFPPRARLIVVPPFGDDPTVIVLDGAAIALGRGGTDRRGRRWAVDGGNLFCP